MKKTLKLGISRRFKEQVQLSIAVVAFVYLVYQIALIVGIFKAI
ncbi:MAG: hypothetical protein WDN66_02860 [Candidatus Saccharibacteria bacterium]